MAIPELDYVEQFVDIRASCSACGWSGQTSFRGGDPHPEQMFASAVSDLEVLHKDESPECRSPIQVSK